MSKLLQNAFNIEKMEKQINRGGVFAPNRWQLNQIISSHNQNAEKTNSTGIDVIELSIDKPPVVMPNTFHHVSSILLVGSGPNNGWCEFSDIDLLVIMDGKHFEINKLESDIVCLKTLCNRIFEMDPLMHHGLMFADRRDSAHFFMGGLPAPTLRLARCVWGKKSIATAFLPTEEEKDKAVTKMMTHNRNLEIALEQISLHSSDDYRLKYFISSLLLTPVLFLAAQGRFVSKRDSFRVCYQEYPQINWEVIQRAEDIRIRWVRPTIHLFHRFALSIGGPKVQRIARYFYHANARNFLREIGELQNSMRLLLFDLNKALGHGHN